AMIKDLLVEEEQNELFPKFNVDGLMRGDYKSRMEGYAIAINNGIMSVNDVRRLENLDPLDEAEGGDFHIINGSYTKLADVGKNYGGNSVAEQEKRDAGDDSREEAEAGQEQPSEEALEREVPGHARRRAERKAAWQGKQPRKDEK
ncbi:MAG: phage portal protein, partial [Clostridia bacterium]|nr:phage portal protein [Clostridia bacterium]